MKLICGPMATVSHPAFRFLIEKFGGCDEYFTEMINAGTLLVNGPFEKYYINPLPVPEKLVWQLTGFSIDKMVQAAQEIVTYKGIGLDINMGCSAPAIYKTGAGISWMLKPLEETKSLVANIKSVVNDYNLNHLDDKKRLSVKLRLGDEDFTDNSFFSFTDMLVEQGVELLTLHPRTKKEKLTRLPRYSYCEQLKQRYKSQNVQVYLNGNVKDIQSYNHAVNSCPNIDGIMISRACVQKPWIFKQLQNQNDENNQDVDLEQLSYDYIDLIEEYQPEEFWKTRLQRFFSYFSLNFQFSHYAQTQFLNSSDNDDLRNRIHDFFIKCPQEKFIKI